MAERVFPTITMSGTSGAELFRQYEAAGDALDKFFEAWSAIEFNGRDYRAPGSFHAAARERVDMFEKVRDVRDYLSDHAESIYDQNEARQRK